VYAFDPDSCAHVYAWNTVGIIKSDTAIDDVIVSSVMEEKSRYGVQ
jgi:hypothetical protein